MKDLRAQILDALTKGPQSSAGLAKAFNISKRTVQYNLMILKQKHWIAIIAEKYYLEGYEEMQSGGSPLENLQVVIIADMISFYLRHGWRYISTVHLPKDGDRAIVQFNRDNAQLLFASNHSDLES